MNSSKEVRFEKITLYAADGYKIAATRYFADGSVKGHIVVAGATGVRQDFYRGFAEFASRRGFTTLTLDYRGIGLSKPASLKGFEMNFLDWATLDLAAGVDEMASETVPLFVVGHSFGGHALGALPNHDLIKGCYVFATGSGWHGWMPFMESLRVRFLWNIVLPVLAKWKGYSPWEMLGMGEDLPLGVYEQWRYWCKFKHYFFDDPEMSHMAEVFAKVRMPIAAANALDDLWALPQSRDAFMQGYRNCQVERIDLDPKLFSGGIGHMGYFRKKAEPLWKDVIDWFSRRIDTLYAQNRSAESELISA